MLNRDRAKHLFGAVVAIAIGSSVSACNGAPFHAAAAPQLPTSGLRSERAALPAVANHSGRLGSVLTSRDGGQIFGFAIGQDDRAGILSTSAHIETFDQSSGAITDSFPKITPQRTTYGLDGVFAGGLALITRYVQPKGSIYATRYYDVVSPFTAGTFTGKWTPPIFDVDVQQGGQDPGSSTSVLFAIELKNTDVPDLFVSDIAANTFGKVIHLDPNKFSLGDQPQLASFVLNGDAVLATSPDAGTVGGAAPINVLANLSTGAVRQSNGYNSGPYGAGFVNGMALDPNTAVEVTTTELNAQVEFYNAHTGTGIADVQLPCTGSADQSNSAAGVAVDTVHKLFLVTDPAYACDGSEGGALVIYDEHGTVVETIRGFTFAIAEPAPAIDPSKRLGWAFGPRFDQLQQFFY